MGKTARACALAALLAAPALVPAAARADGPATAASASSTAPATASTAPSGAPAAPDSAAPSASASGPAPGTEATGYGWSTPKRKAGRASTASAAHHPVTEGPGAVVPGFEMLGDGSTRVFVQMPRAPTYATRLAKGTVTYVIKDIQVDKRNNYNPLVTVHFNTPVTSARLVPHGRDLWLVIALRAKVMPTVALQPAKDGTSVLQVDFPKGDYLPPASARRGSPDDGAGTPATSGR